jgi:hypothetical protein
MKAIISLVTLLLLFPAAWAQDYEPTILILAPHKAETDRKLQKELKEINATLQPNAPEQKSTDYTESDEFAALPENIKLMTRSEIKFSKGTNFIKMTSYIAQQYLSYQFYERFPNLLILLSGTTSSEDKRKLMMLADSANTQYVLNFPSISFFKKGSLSYANVRVQLFDRSTGDYMIDSQFTGDSNNPGFEFACKGGTLHCTINNALSQALANVGEIIAKNSPTLQRERMLKQERYDKLMTNHFPKSGSFDLVRQVIHGDQQISSDNIFYVLYDGSNTKFLAFSLEKVESHNLKSLADNGKDRNVNIISSKTIKDKGFLESMPQTYAFIIKGVKFEGEWYYEKANATYFESSSIEEGRKKYFNNLQEWNFFMQNSSMVSPDFWETALFEKVPDLRQHADWDKYGDEMWKAKEANNRGYVGMYEIVANVKRRKKQAENKLFEMHLKNNVLKPVYDGLKKKEAETWARYSEHSLIYSSAKDIVINPVLLTNSKRVQTVHYFVAFPKTNEIFEWTYFPEHATNEASDLFGSIVVDQLESITEWNFSFDTLDDEVFWKQYVLMKEDGRFKYLKKVELE